MLRSTIMLVIASLILFGCEIERDEALPQTIFENEFAKVSHITLEPGVRQPLHHGEDRIIYSLNDYTVEFHQNETEIEEHPWKADDVHFHEAGEHYSINIGEGTAEWLVFDRKTENLPPAEDLHTDIEEDLNLNENTTDLFENNLFKVTKVQEEPGVAIPEHEGGNRVVYSLSNYTIEYESDREEDRTREFEIGDIHWHQAAEHSV